MSFETKKWLDVNVIPLLQNELELHSLITKKPDTASGVQGTPEAVLVWLLVREEASWSGAVRRLLSSGFAFDFLRDVQVVSPSPGVKVTIFGGDGTPFVNNRGMAMARLFKKIDGIELLVEVGKAFGSGTKAAAEVKLFFSQFDGISPQELCERHRPAFGAA